MMSFCVNSPFFFRYSKVADQLPFAVVSKEVEEFLQKKVLKDYASFHSGFVHTNKIDPKIKKDGPNFVASDKSADYKNKKTHSAFFILTAETQIGKTQPALKILARMRLAVMGDAEEEDIEEDDEEEAEKEEESVDAMQKESILKWFIPREKTLRDSPSVPCTVSQGKYDRLHGPYEYPNEPAPVRSAVGSKEKKRKTKRSASRAPSNYNSTHSTALCGEACVDKRARRNHVVRASGIPCVQGDRVQVFLSVPDCHPYSKMYEVLLLHDLKTKPIDLSKSQDLLSHEMMWIFTPTCGRADVGRLCFRNFVGHNDYFHFLFVRKEEFKAYQETAGRSHIIVTLSDTMTDVDVDCHNGGIGYARRFIQRFASALLISAAYMADDTIVCLKRVVDDGQGSVERADGKLSFKPSRLAEFHKETIQRIGEQGISQHDPSFTCSPLGSEVSLPEELKDGSTITLFKDFTGAKQEYAQISMLLSRGQQNLRLRNPFIRSHAKALVWMNFEGLREKGLMYKPLVAREDLFLSNQADAEGLLAVKALGWLLHKHVQAMT